MNNVKNSQELRSRAVRTIAGGLLMSSLSNEELKKIASHLDLEFLEMLREVLLSIQLRSGASAEYSQENAQSDSNSIVDAIYNRIKSRKFTKSRAISYMRQANPRLPKNFENRSASLRELTNEFIELGSPEHVHRLFNLISGRLEQDAYLTGITARK